MWKIRDLPWPERIHPTLASFLVLPFLPLLLLLEGLSGTTWQWSFHLISITIQDWTRLWIPSLNLPLLHQMNWFQAANLTDLQKGKKTTSCEKWLLGGVLQKSFLKILQNSQRFLCGSLFLILLKVFTPSGLQRY